MTIETDTDTTILLLHTNNNSHGSRSGSRSGSMITVTTMLLYHRSLFIRWVLVYSKHHHARREIERVVGTTTIPHLTTHLPCRYHNTPNQ